MRYFTAACCALALTAMVSTAAKADEENKLTYVTFSGAVQVPGATLPAGTYTFRLADPINGRHVLQILSKENSHLVATLLTIPSEQLEPSDKPVVMFRETAAGESPAVRAWFYPGERYGQEFVYPRQQAMKIAKASRTPVLAMADNTKSDSASLAGSQIGRVDENGGFSTDRTANMEPVTLTADNRTTPMPVGTSGVAQSSSSATMRRELPRTASNMPLVAFLGGLAIAGALALRRAQQGLAR